MKKVLLLMILAVSSLTAGAQVYVGGEVGFWRNWKDGANKTNFSINPEVGYNLSSDWAVGLNVGYLYKYEQGLKTNAFIVAPYARYTFAKFGNVNLFADATVGFASYKVKGTDADKAWQFGIRPGVAVNLTEKLSFIAHVGFLGYRTSDNSNSPFGSNGLGVNIDGNALQFGLYYNF